MEVQINWSNRFKPLWKDRIENYSIWKNGIKIVSGPSIGQKTSITFNGRSVSNGFPLTRVHIINILVQIQVFIENPVVISLVDSLTQQMEDGIISIHPQVLNLTKFHELIRLIIPIQVSISFSSVMVRWCQ